LDILVESIAPTDSTDLDSIKPFKPDLI